MALARLKSQIISSPNYCNLQSAYRLEHSTETALIKDDIYRTVDSSSAVALVWLDISEAFDAVNHRILLERLEAEFEISRPPIQWIASYLANRTFVVKVGTSTSPAVLTNTGVPQGSVLGPILFTSYVAPIGRLIDSFNVGCHKYADDTQLYTALKSSPQMALDQLERCSTELQLWFWRNDLLLNPDKSEVCFLRCPAEILQDDATTDCQYRWK